MYLSLFSVSLVLGPAQIIPSLSTTIGTLAIIIIFKIIEFNYNSIVIDHVKNIFFPANLFGNSVGPVINKLIFMALGSAAHGG